MQPTTNRKLAAIMFTDVAGFTAMMQKDEQDCLIKRNRYVEVLEKCHKNRNGEIIKHLGDGALSVFSNSVDAVWCAIEMLKELKSPVEVPVRIGIHSGNVLFEPGDVIGDAVNIASRIESYSMPGGVLISDSVHDQIKNQQGLDFVSLGKFKLKNVDRPFEIFAVAAEGLVVPDPDFLQGKGEKLSNLMNNVPVISNPLLGRDADVKQLTDLVMQHKIVTVTGTGGMGKTRIVTEICHLMADEFSDGITYVSLADITEPEGLIPALAEAFGIKAAEGRTFKEAIATLIFDKKSLVVLDNLEQIIGSAPDIAWISSRCPNLKILTTSRTPLKVSAEREYPLAPLSLPAKAALLNIESLMNYPAVALFVERAKKVKNNFELTPENAEDIVKICQQLDGLPLAIELAAARIRMLTPKTLLQRLSHALDILTAGSRDLPERHQTLRATIDWSFSLLNDNEQNLFRRMAVFQEGFTIAGLETICYDGSSSSVLDELESLLDKGLVQPVSDDERFRLLQTIKEFANEKLREAGEEELVLYRHAKYYRELAKVIANGVETVDQKKWMTAGPLEEPNIYAALDFLLEKGKGGDAEAIKLGLGLVGEFWIYWHNRGKHVSTLEYTDAFLALPACPESGIEKCKALTTAALASWTMGSFDRCLELWQQSYDMAKELNVLPERAINAMSLGVGYIGKDMNLAVTYVKEGVEISRKLQYNYALGLSLGFNGLINLIMGEVPLAKESLEEALGIQRKLKDSHGAGFSLSVLALIASKEGKFDLAIDGYKESIALFAAAPDNSEEARVQSEIAWLYLSAGKIYEARNHFFESIELYEKVGSVRGIGLALIGIASVEAVEQQFHKAVRIAAAAELFAKQLGIVNVYTDDFEGSAYIEKAKSELTPAELIQAEIEGARLSVKEALALAKSFDEVVTF